MDDDLMIRIDALKTLIKQQEENYKSEVTENIGYNELKELRTHIRELKDELEILLGKADLTKR